MRPEMLAALKVQACHGLQSGRMVPAALFSVAFLVMPGVLWAATAQCSKDFRELSVMCYLTSCVEQVSHVNQSSVEQITCYLKFMLPEKHPVLFWRHQDLENPLPLWYLTKQLIILIAFKKIEFLTYIYLS